MALFLYGAAAGAAAVALFFLRREAFTRRRLAALFSTAERVAGGDSAARASDLGQDSIGKLATTLNLLAEGFAHDVSELKRLELVRREFVANVSHELRTPLASIKAFAETVSSSELSGAERAEFVGEIEKAAERMSTLVDDLLNLAALESGKLPPRFERLEVLPVAAEVLAALKPLASRKNIVLRPEALGAIPAVRADRAQLKQVLTNLVDNAIKFTQDGGTVWVGGARHESQSEVWVRDNGPGIQAADLPRVFERFYRADKARNSESGGTGLGLSIAKHIAEVHGGRLTAENHPDGGAVFRLFLPAA
jgi:two-component system phosphate regulon sensor histidine kinase PhoR